jgi:hypothetical protein
MRRLGADRGAGARSVGARRPAWTERIPPSPRGTFRASVLENLMPVQLQISQQDLDRLTMDCIGAADIDDDKVVDKVAMTYPYKCFTTTTVHTSGTC